MGLDSPFRSVPFRSVPFRSVPFRSVLYSAHRLMPACLWTCLSDGVLTNAEGARPCLCRAAPPTAVGDAHNSPVPNATIIFTSGLVQHYRLHLYNQSGVLYFTR